MLPLTSCAEDWRKGISREICTVIYPSLVVDDQLLVAGAAQRAKVDDDQI